MAGNFERKKAELVKPDVVYKTAYLSALHEYHQEERNLHYEFKALEADFEGFVQGLLEKADRAKLEPGAVEESIFWLVEGSEYIGRVSLRPRMNEKLLNFDGNIGCDIKPTRRKMGYGTLALELGLSKAREAGLRRALVTCNWDNEGSRKIIESCGGVFEDSRTEIRKDGTPNEVLRYWFELV